MAVFYCSTLNIHKMNTFIENRKSMYHATKGVCEDNITLITANAGVASTYNRFMVLLKEMDDLSRDQAMNRTGVTVDKQFARNKLNLGIDKSAGYIVSHFTSVHNFTIANSVDKALSTVQGMSDQTVIGHGQLVVNILAGNQPVLAPFGVDAPYIDSYNVTLTNYITIVATPTIARNFKKALTRLQLDKSKEISRFLRKELDKAMTGFKDDHLDFYLTYKNARRIVQNGIRHHTFGTIAGVVKDGESHLVLDGALVEVTGTTTHIVTNESGLFTISTVPPGTYTLKVSIGGYAIKIIENVIVTAHQTMSLEVLMVASV